MHAGHTAPRREPAEGILAAIGDTPLVALRRLLLRPDVSVWAKLEASNPGGSAKDRPAAQMLRDALACD
jgi:N-(2-amino-2-carboxyethyl)-L-glutamate synthase